MIRTRPVLVSALSLSLFAAACSDDHDTAKFTGADDAHLERFLDVLTLGDAASLYIIGAFISGENQVGCPTITTTGAVTTISAGCTTEDGELLEGRIVITNVQGAFTENPAYDPSKPSLVEAFDWRATDGAGVQSVDGRVTITNDGGNPDNGGVLDATVSATLDGIAAQTDVTVVCDATSLCTPSSGSWIEVDGVGSATTSGTFRFGDPPTGSLTATGAETLVLDVAATVDDCRTFTIDGGASRQLCAPAEARLAPRTLLDLAGAAALARGVAGAAEVELLREALLDHVGDRGVE